MKLRLPNKLVAALMAAMSAATFTTLSTGSTAYATETPAAFEGDTLGNVMYIGDSITNGYGGMVSWRWQFFKMLTDNGISQTEQGINTGRSDSSKDFQTTKFVNQVYGGATFENIHSAYSSGRAWEVSGRKQGWDNRYKYSNIKNWLGSSTTQTNNQTYSGTQYTGDKAIDTFFMLIGTNDLLSDTGYSSDQFNNKYNNLLGYDAATDTLTHSETADLEVIYNTIKTQSPSSDIVMLTIPTTGTNSGNVCSDATVTGVMKYNELLTQWVTDKNAGTGPKINLIDVNKGLIDVTASEISSTTRTTVANAGPSDFFADGLHPNKQGELIIAGNVAKGMGIGGRTAGLTRSAATADGWNHAEQTEYALGGSTLTFAENAFTTANGYTVDFGAVFGDGEANGWADKTNALSLTIGDGSHTGTLNMSEGYIMWGSDILYSQDNHANTDNIRIAYHNGSTVENVAAGYYVWLGDMLIGEGLSSTDGALNGVTLSALGSGTGSISNLSWANTAYAPTTTGTYNSSTAFLAATEGSTNNTAQGIKTDITWTPGSVGFIVPSGTASATTPLYKEISDSTTGFSGGTNADYAGNLAQKYTGTAGASVGVLGAWGGQYGHVTLTGDLYMEFDSTGTFGKWRGSGGTDTDSASVVGAYNADITGSVRLVLNNGSFSSSVFGGNYTGNYTIGGGTHVYVNGGTIGGHVFGGGREASTINNGSAVTVTGGVIEGSVYGGGMAGTINGGTSVTITGGIIRGNVFGGMSTETAGHYTGDVTVQSNHASIAGSINANNVTLKNIENGNYTSGTDRYHGAINATTQVKLDGYTASHLNAAITTQRVLLTNNSQTTISNLNLTACDITAEAGSSLTLEGTLTLGNTATYSGNITVADGITFSMSETALGNADGTYTYSQGTSGFRAVGTVTLLTPGDGSSRLNGGAEHLSTSTYTGAGALAGASFSYDHTTGKLSASPVSADFGTTYYVNSPVIYKADAAIYDAEHIIVNNGGDLTLATGLKDGVTVEGAAGATSSAITVSNGVTLTKPTQVTGTIASYVVNQGGLLDWSGNSTFGEVTVDLSSTVSGNGTVKVAFANGGHSGYVKTKPSGSDSDFHGTLDLSGNFNLNSLNSNNASDITYNWHNGSFWHNSTVSVANRVLLGEAFIMRASGNTTFTGQVTGDSVTIGYSGNGGRVYFNNAASAIGTVTLQNGASVQYNSTFTGDTIVKAGTTMYTTDNSDTVGSAAEAVQYHGSVQLQGNVTTNAQGNAVENFATLQFTDGSTYIDGGVTVQDNGIGKVVNSWAKQQYIHSFSGENVTLTIHRNNGDSGKGGFIHVMNEGNLSGTVKLTNAANDYDSGLILVNSGAALANSVVEFAASGSKAELAFVSNNSIYNESRKLNSTLPLTDGAVAGLAGAAGRVQAANLTIDTESTHVYSGDLLVNKLTVSGAGSQSLTGSNTISGGAVVENGATLELGGTTQLGGTIANSGTLTLNDSISVDSTNLRNFEVIAATGSGSAYSGTGTYAGSGYLSNATAYIVKNDGGTMTNNATITGVTVEEASDGLTFHVADTTTYYVNSNLDYNNDEMGNAGKLNIADGVTLTASANPTGAKSLSGSGTYKTTTQTNICRVTATDESWTGTVELRRFNLWNGSATPSRVDLTTLGNVNSKIKLAGVWGIDNSWNTGNAINTNLILENVPDPGQGNMEYAWWINNGSSNSNKTYVFNGTIEGSGTLKKSGDNNYRQDFTFNGDVSKWTGMLDYARTSNQDAKITFANAATTVNAAIMRNYEGGNKLQLILGTPTNGATEYQINNTIKVDVLNATGQNVVLGRTPVLGADDAKPTFTVTGAVTAARFTLAKDMNATFGTISTTQDSIIEQGATLTLTGGASNFLTNVLQHTSGEGLLVVEGGANFDNNVTNRVGELANNAYALNVTTQVNGNLAFNAWGKNTDAASVTLNKTMTVTEELRLETLAKLAIAEGGKLSAATLGLGHAIAGNPGHLVIDGGELAVGTIGLNGTADGAANTIVMNSGTWTHTAEGNAFSNSVTTGATTAQGNTTVALNGGTLKADTVSWNFNHAATLGSMTLDAAQGKTLTISGVLSDATGEHGSLTKTGEGTVVLSGLNTFTGDITVSGGTLQLGSSNALGSINGGESPATPGRTITIEKGGVIDIHGAANTDYKYAYTLAGGSLVNNGDATGSGNVQTPSLTLTADSSLGGTSAFYLINNGWHATSIAMAGHILTKEGTNTVGLYSTAVSGGGTLRVEGGTLNFTRNNSNPVSSADADIVVAHGDSAAVSGELNLEAGHSISSVVEGGLVSAAIHMKGATTLNAEGSNTLTLSGVLNSASGATGSVIKTGTGVVNISGANSALNALDVQSGILNVTNGATMTDLTMAAGTQLNFTSGSSTISGAITANNSSTIGISNATLTVSNATNTAKSMPGVTMNAGTLHLSSASAGRQYSINSLTVTGTDNLIDAANGGFHAQLDIADLSSGAAGAELTFAGNAMVNCASVININGGDNGAFDGTLHVKQALTAGHTNNRHIAMNLADADVLSNAVISLESAVVGFNTSYVALGIATNATVKGITSTNVARQKNILLSGSVALGTSNNDYNGDGVTRTLTINTGDSAETSYTANVNVKGNLSLTKQGAGTQSLILGDGSSLMAVSADGGTLHFGGETMAQGEKADISMVSLRLNGGTTELSGASYTIAGGSVSHGLFTGNGQLVIKDNADVTLNAHMEKNEDWQFEMQAGADKGVSIENGSSFTVDTLHANDKSHTNDYNLKVTGVQSDAATITANANRSYNILADNITIANAQVELNKRENGGNFANKLDNSSFTNTGSTAIALTNSENTLTAVHAENGAIVVEHADSSAASLKSIKATGADITLKGLQQAASVSLNELVIGENKKVSATDTVAAAQTRSADPTDAEVFANIEVTGTQDEHGHIEVGIGGATQGINLAVNTAANHVDYSAIPGSVLNLNGGSLTLSTIGDNRINLSDAMMAQLGNHAMIEVMSGIGALTVNDINFDLGDMTEGEMVIVGSASSVFGNNFYNQNAQVLFRADNGGTGTLLVTPEPATTALSLLALSALAARRKRH